MSINIIKSDVQFTPIFDIFNTSGGLKISNGYKTITNKVQGWNTALSEYEMVPDQIYYCEFKIEIMNDEKQIIIGIVDHNFSVLKTRHMLKPSNDHSYSIYLHDNHTYDKNKTQRDCYILDPDDLLKVGDTFGILYNGITGDLVFTRNQESLGVAFKNIPTNNVYRVAISMHMKDDKITAV